MSDIRIIYTLFDSSEKAKAASKILIEEQLVACANHLAPATSQYMWDGALQESMEFPVLLKTGEKLAVTAMKRLKSLHDYDVPAIISVAPDSCDNDYQTWLLNQLKTR